MSMSNSVAKTVYYGKITPEIAQKMDMRPGDWFRNARLWECYKNHHDTLSRCQTHEDVIATGLVPDELIITDCVDLDLF